MGLLSFKAWDVEQKEINLHRFQLQLRCIHNTLCLTSALLDELFKDLSVEAILGECEQLRTAASPVDFSVVKQPHLVNQKLPFLFRLKNPSMNKQRVCLFAEVSYLK